MEYVTEVSGEIDVWIIWLAVVATFIFLVGMIALPDFVQKRTQRVITISATPIYFIFAGILVAGNLFNEPSVENVTDQIIDENDDLVDLNSFLFGVYGEQVCLMDESTLPEITDLGRKKYRVTLFADSTKTICFNDSYLTFQSSLVD